jgi:hypothetical protein
LAGLDLPLYPDKNGKESYWKSDPDYRTGLSVPFSLSELLSLYLAQDASRPLEGTVLYDALDSLFDKVRAIIPKPLFRQMVELRGSFLSGIPAKKDYGVLESSSRLSKKPSKAERLCEFSTTL